MPLWCSRWSSNETTDYDGDGYKDDLFEDLVDDNDAIPDLSTIAPGPASWVTSSEEDYDQDGCRDDTEDDDDDDDLIDDNLDACPLGENTWYSILPITMGMVVRLPVKKTWMTITMAS